MIRRSEFLAHNPDRATPSFLVVAWSDALPDSRAPRAVPCGGHAEEWLVGCAKDRTGIALFGDNIRATHGLPAAPAWVAVQHDQTCAVRGCDSKCTFQELWLEADIAVQPPIARFRKDERLHERGRASRSLARPPHAEADVLLTICTEQMTHSGFMHRLRHRDAVLAAHCESHSAHRWLRYAATVFRRVCQSLAGRDQYCHSPPAHTSKGFACST